MKLKWLVSKLEREGKLLTETIEVATARLAAGLEGGVRLRAKMKFSEQQVILVN